MKENHAQTNWTTNDDDDERSESSGVQGNAELTSKLNALQQANAGTVKTRGISAARRHEMREKAKQRRAERTLAREKKEAGKARNPTLLSPM